MNTLKEIFVYDTETTGFANTDQVIEVAHIIPPPLQELRSWKEEDINLYLQAEHERSYSERFKPSVPISQGAFGVHGILYKDLLKCRKSEEYKLPEEVKYLVGHNISYDYRMIGKPAGVKLICTKALAEKFNKEFSLGHEASKLDYLMGFYFPADAARLIGKNHNALGDCKKVIMLLTKLLPLVPALDTWEKLYEFQKALKNSYNRSKKVE